MRGYLYAKTLHISVWINVIKHTPGLNIVGAITNRHATAHCVVSHLDDLCRSRTRSRVGRFDN